MDPWLFRRISVRYLVDGQAFDVIGRVLHRTSDVVQLMRRDGQIEDVPVVDIIAAREVPEDKRRLRPVHDFPTEKLNEIIERAFGSLAPELRVLIASCSELKRDPTESSSVTVSAEADEQWLRLVFQANERSETELAPLLPHAYLQIGVQGAARAVLAGDWLGLYPLSVPDDTASTQVAEQLLAAARDWAEPRGAAYVFALVRPEQDGLLSTLEGLGFRDVAVAN